MAKLTLSVDEGGSFSSVISAMFDHLPGFPQSVEGSVTLVQEGTVPAGSANPHYVAIEIDLPDLDRETLEALRPIFRMLAALIKAQSSKNVTATITLDGRGGPVFYEVFGDE